MRKGICRIALCLLALLFVGCAGQKNEGETGFVAFTVLDGLNGTPIEGVKIVLPESGQTLVTDGNGKTEQTSMPVIRDTRAPLAQEYGTFTVLGYCEGYHEYALFYAQIRPGQERSMKLFLFPVDSPMSNGAPLAVVESPEKDWVQKIADPYRKYLFVYAHKNTERLQFKTQKTLDKPILCKM